MDMKNSPLALLNDAALLRTGALINGQWTALPQRFAVCDPATGLNWPRWTTQGPSRPSRPLRPQTPPGPPGAPSRPRSAPPS